METTITEVMTDEMVNKCEAVEEEEEEEKAADEKGDIMETTITEGIDPLALSEDEKWIKHYSSRHKILLVGEGDFSFSAALATAFGDASNMVATSLNSYGFLSENYMNALSNIDMLENKGCTVIHGVDVKTMAHNLLLLDLKFDRIVFNFPFARVSRQSPFPKLRCQQGLVRAYLENAVQMIGEDGEIHVTHKTNGNNIDWNIGGLACEQGLTWGKAVSFSLDDYPGYNTKRGFGGDANFNCYPSKTYIFRLSLPSAPEDVSQFGLACRYM